MGYILNLEDRNKLLILSRYNTSIVIDTIDYIDDWLTYREDAWDLSSDHTD